MVDMVKKVHKKGAEFLNAGEQIEAASAVQAVGQFKKQVAFGAVGGLVGAAMGNALKGKAEEADTGTMAESFPNEKSAILALSNQRWIVFEMSAMSGAPKRVLAEYGHDQIDRLELDAGKLTTRLDVVFADGSVSQVEAVKAAKPDKLAEAANRRR